MAKKRSVLDWIAFILLIVGGLNWGFALFGFNLITTIFSFLPVLVDIVYALVGVSALYLIYYLFK
jgi:uncharacterized membrane protein YuzA (DUF378 family)